MERYRSGHNEAVLKTVCPQGRVGSNPTLSAMLLYVTHTAAFILPVTQTPPENNQATSMQYKDKV